MKPLLLLIALFTSTEISAQYNYHWQHPVPTGHSYYDVQMLSATTAVAVGMQGTVIRTTDAGQSWSYHFANTLADLRDVHFCDSLHGYAVGSAYFWSQLSIVKTMDGGITWDTINPGVTNDFYGVYFINPDTGWIAGTGGGIFRTNDGGTSWTDQSIGGSLQLNTIYMLNADTGYVGGAGGILQKTTNGGASWNPASSGTTYEIHDLFFLNNDTGWLCGAGETIRRTNDGWQNSAPQYFTAGSTEIYSVMFFDSLRGFAASQPYLYYTDDGGATWNDVNNFGNQPMAADIDPSGNGILAGMYGTIQNTSDTGMNWNSIAGASNYNHFFNIQFTDKTHGWCVGEYANILKTTDGVNWITLTSQGPDYRNLYFLDNQTGYVVGEAGAVRKTVNGGASFTNHNIPVTTDLYGVFFLNPSLGWVCGLSGTIYKTVNGGTSWTPQTLPTFAFNADEIWFANPDTGYIGSWGNKIYKTVNGGSTWTEIFVPSGVSDVLDMQFFNADTGWFSTSYGMMFKTTDGGLTFSTPHQFCFSPGSGFHFYDELNGFAGGGTVNWNCKLFRTTDGGDTWQNTDLPFGYGILGAYMTDTNSVYLSGEYGNIIHYGDSLLPVSVEEHEIMPAVNIYPNPAAGFFTISSVRELTKVIVFNSTLKEVFTADPYSTSIMISAKSLASGVYFVDVLYKDGSRCVQKLIVL